MFVIPARPSILHHVTCAPAGTPRYADAGVMVEAAVSPDDARLPTVYVEARLPAGYVAVALTPADAERLGVALIQLADVARELSIAAGR